MSFGKFCVEHFNNKLNICPNLILNKQRQHNPSELAFDQIQVFSKKGVALSQLIFLALGYCLADFLNLI